MSALISVIKYIILIYAIIVPYSLSEICDHLANKFSIFSIFSISVFQWNLFARVLVPLEQDLPCGQAVRPNAPVQGRGSFLSVSGVIQGQLIGQHRESHVRAPG